MRPLFVFRQRLAPRYEDTTFLCRLPHPDLHFGAWLRHRRPERPPPPAIAGALNLKPTSADARAVQELMVALIQADTSNPPGNEGLAVAALSAFFEANGITSRTVTAPGLEDRPILIAELRAPRRFKKPLVLLGHTDVVPADAKAWKNGRPLLGA